ncbi:MAG: 4Fe-4S binding protein [Desulfotomaculales bacterium]
MTTTQAQKPAKEVVIRIGGAQFTVPPGVKVKDAAAAGVEIPPLKVDPATCKGCQMCTKACETGAISGKQKRAPHYRPGSLRPLRGMPGEVQNRLDHPCVR